MCEIFSRRHKNRVQAHYWPHFLAKLLEYKKSPDLEVFCPSSLVKTFTYSGVEPPLAIL